MGVWKLKNIEIQKCTEYSGLIPAEHQWKNLPPTIVGATMKNSLKILLSVSGESLQCFETSDTPLPPSARKAMVGGGVRGARIRPEPREVRIERL